MPLSLDVSMYSKKTSGLPTRIPCLVLGLWFLALGSWFLVFGFCRAFGVVARVLLAREVRSTPGAWSLAGDATAPVAASQSPEKRKRKEERKKGRNEEKEPSKQGSTHTQTDTQIHRHTHSTTRASTNHECFQSKQPKALHHHSAPR